jgi:hypothetical protein
MWWGIIAAAMAIFLGCATMPTPRGIAADFAANLEMLRDWNLAVRCTAVEDAKARCLRAGFPADCGWNGFDDADHDAFSIAACRERP